MKTTIPEEVEILKSLPWVSGLKLAGVEHQESDEVQPSHHWWISSFQTHWERQITNKMNPTDCIENFFQMLLTKLCALSRWFKKQLEFVQHQRHVDGMAAQTFHPKEKRYGRFELRGQEKHLEVQEGLVAGREMRFTWKQLKRVLNSVHTFTNLRNNINHICTTHKRMKWIWMLL